VEKVEIFWCWLLLKKKNKKKGHSTILYRQRHCQTTPLYFHIIEGVARERERPWNAAANEESVWNHKRPYMHNRIEIKYNFKPILLWECNCEKALVMPIWLGKYSSSSRLAQTNRPHKVRILVQLFPRECERVLKNCLRK
jgi:hypothetical protein